MDETLKDPLLLAFFATLGLGADVRSLARGGQQARDPAGAVRAADDPAERHRPGDGAPARPASAGGPAGRLDLAHRRPRHGRRVCRQLRRDAQPAGRDGTRHGRRDGGPDPGQPVVGSGGRAPDATRAGAGGDAPPANRPPPRHRRESVLHADHHRATAVRAAGVPRLHRRRAPRARADEGHGHPAAGFPVGAAGRHGRAQPRDAVPHRRHQRSRRAGGGRRVALAVPDHGADVDAHPRPGDAGRAADADHRRQRAA